jgi:hypothetical protein
MEHHHLTDDLDRRLRASRPATAQADDGAYDAELLARVRTQPVAARRSVPRAVALPVAAGVTLTATAAVMLGGGPGDVGGPSSAAAITQTLHWLSPPSGSILHVRSVATQGGRTTTRELWQSADHPAQERERTEGDRTFERSGDAIYDPASDTIYDVPGGTPDGDGAQVKPGQPGGGGLPAGDPVVDKVRILLQDGSMEVRGREIHDGVEAWAIALKPDAGRPVWTLWVSAADGKPLELRDPGRDANEAPQVIRWPTYEVLPDSGAERLLTLTGAHPSATVVDDPARAAAAEGRLMPPKP